MATIEIGQWVHWQAGTNLMRGLFMKDNGDTAIVMVRSRNGIPHAITAEVEKCILNAEPLQ